MRAFDYHRLDTAIHSLAAAKQQDANLLWQHIYFRLNISGLSDLKMKHFNEISRLILGELGEMDAEKGQAQQ